MPLIAFTQYESSVRYASDVLVGMIEYEYTYYLTYDDGRHCPGFILALICHYHNVVHGQRALFLQGITDRKFPR